MIIESDYSCRASYGLLSLKYIQQGQEAIRETEYEIRIRYVRLTEQLMGLEHIRGTEKLWRLCNEGKEN